MTDDIEKKVAGTEEIQNGILKTRSHLVLNVKGDNYSFPLEYNYDSLRWYQGKHREAYAAIMSDGRKIEQRRELRNNYREYCRTELRRKKEIAEFKIWRWA
ncbi:MAG: hypothetical protein QXK08_00115 [Candidatus Woesearchaeota archaeon]